MKAALFLVMLTANVDAFAAQVIDVHRIADAIYRAEGGRKARPAYGIKGVKVRNTAHAREVCIRTIRSAHAEWDGEGDFIEFLSRKYAPIGARNDPGNLNSHWARNVRHHMEKLP